MIAALDRNGRKLLRQALKRAATLILGRYRLNRIYRMTAVAVEQVMPPGIDCRLLEDPPASAADVDPELREQFWYGGDDAHGYGLFLEGRLAAACWFWGCHRFTDPGLWVLGKDESFLIEVLTAPRYRGQGLAPLLIQYASGEMFREKYERLFCSIWHNHSASYRAFEKAGWTQVARVIEVRPFGVSPPIRFCLRRSPRGIRAGLADSRRARPC
ncbi:MAG: GNAT family N-acetyltransferase [Stellaceae bacterium]